MEFLQRPDEPALSNCIVEDAPAVEPVGPIAIKAGRRRHKHRQCLLYTSLPIMPLTELLAVPLDTERGPDIFRELSIRAVRATWSQANKFC